VRGKLKVGLDGLDILSACYPPLVSYPEDLRECTDPLEAPPEFYGGVVGRWASPIEFSAFLNLRALEIKQGWIQTRSGAGIVDGADPAFECAEIMLKLASVLDPVEAWLGR
jgi:anthranilate/para-aminobenzoate synthase component I